MEQYGKTNICPVCGGDNTCGEAECTVTPYVENLMKNDLGLEIEMMRGELRITADGGIFYHFWVCDKQKQELLQKWLTHCFASEILKPENLS